MRQPHNSTSVRVPNPATSFKYKGNCDAPQHHKQSSSTGTLQICLLHFNYFLQTFISCQLHGIIHPPKILHAERLGNMCAFQLHILFNLPFAAKGRLKRSCANLGQWVSRPHMMRLGQPPPSSSPVIVASSKLPIPGNLWGDPGGETHVWRTEGSQQWV